MENLIKVDSPEGRLGRVGPNDLAWIALLPGALAIVGAIILLGPPLGHALRPSAGDVPWPRGLYYVIGQPEPVKHARFAIAQLGAPLLVAVVLASARRPLRLTPAAARILVSAAQLLMIALLVAAVLGQRNIPRASRPWPWHVFDASALMVAVVLAPLALVAVRRFGIAGSVAGWARDTRARRVACMTVAAVLTAVWLLPAINTEGSTGLASFIDLPPWAMADMLAILNGRTPLVNYYPLYGELWAYIAAGPALLLGATIGVFSITMCTISGLTLLTVYGTFRRIARNPLLGLALFLPLLATSFFVMPWRFAVPELPGLRPNNAQIFSVWPMRYAGPYLLAWLTARHIDGAWPRRLWPISLLGGLVVLNNVEFGAGAFAATLVALLCARPPLSRRTIVALGGSMAAGLLAAAALAVLLALVRSGTLPHPAFLLEYPRIYGAGGYTGTPMPTLGFHLVIYATFLAAIGAAAVRFVSGEPDRMLTSMLAWSGVFGMGAGTYFAGRSDIFKLVALFSAWSFALSMLTILVVRALAARDWRRPRLPELVVLTGFALTVCSLVQLQAPWSQLTRLRRSTPIPAYAERSAERFVAAQTRPGEKVALLIPMGQRIARNLGITNVAPYAYIEAMVTRRQWSTLIASVRREGAHKVFIPNGQMAPEQARVLLSADFQTIAGRSGYSEWSDAPAGS